MKTSNKILAIFLSIVAFYFLVFALDLRLLGEHRSDGRGPDFEVKIFEVQDFSHLDLHNVVINIEAGESSYIQVDYLSDTSSELHMPSKELQTFQPEYNGDTLRLRNHPGHYGGYRLFLKGGLPSMSANKSRFHINNFEESQLNVDLNESTLGADDQCKIGTLNITASNNSKVNAYNHYQVDTLNITLENSTASFVKPLKQLNGTVDKKSRLDIGHVDDIRIKKEKGSQFYFR